MNKENSFVRLFTILVIALLGSIVLYWLPDSIGGYKLKKVDLLADVRIKPVPLSLDSLMKQLEETDTIPEHEMIPDSLVVDHSLDSVMLALRDSLYRTIYTVAGADSSGAHLEDYSTGHVGLARFFSALESRETLDRPVRIAFLGDSFIEGDIIVADLRTALQKEFGGNGVGFVPVFSITDQYRPTINQKVEGWDAYSILKDTARTYMFSGTLFEPEEKASLSIKPADKYPELSHAASFKFYYTGKKPGVISYVTDAQPDTITKRLIPQEEPGFLEIEEPFEEAFFRFSEGEDMLAFGTAMEDNDGVVVDNFSLRGNSGLILDRLNLDLCRGFSEIRPYDLIVLQYGLNVVSEEVLNYGWYRTRMIGVVRHIQQCFPDTDILLMGVSDRAYQSDDSFETMPAVLALLHAQRQIAKSTGITFWNTFGAMGGVNSMTRFVENNWASKDYTHLSFRGGREIAKAFYEALMLEKEFYDKADETIH
jgi:hypothetical protein